MHLSPALYEVLYVSTIAPDQPLSVVAEIAGRARFVNAELDITGLLIFDGQPGFLPALQPPATALTGKDQQARDVELGTHQARTSRTLGHHAHRLGGRHGAHIEHLGPGGG